MQNSTKPMLMRIFTLIINFGVNLLIASYISQTYGPYFFGLWATFSSIVTFLAFTELSVPQLVFNIITTGTTKNDKNKISNFIRSAQIVLLLLSFIWLAITTLIFVLGGFDTLFPGLTSAERLGFFFSVIAILLSLPLSIGSRILQSQQEFQKVILIQGLIPIINLLGIVIFREMKIDKTVILLLPTMSYLISNLAIYRISSKFLTSFKFTGFRDPMRDVLFGINNLKTLIYGSLFTLSSNIIWNLPRLYLANPKHQTILVLYSYLMLFLSSLQSLILSFNSNAIPLIRKNLISGEQTPTFAKFRNLNLALMSIGIFLVLVLVSVLNQVKFLNVPHSFFYLLPIFGMLWVSYALFLGVYSDGYSVRMIFLCQTAGYIFSLILIIIFHLQVSVLLLCVYFFPMMFFMFLAQIKISNSGLHLKALEYDN